MQFVSANIYVRGLDSSYISVNAIVAPKESINNSYVLELKLNIKLEHYLSNFVICSQLYNMMLTKYVPLSE